MAYCTVSDVQAEIKGAPTFSTSTSPTLAAVTAWIAEGDAEIDARLAQKYTVPITGTASLLVMRRISIDLIKARLNEFWDIKTGKSETEQNPPTKGPRDRAMEMLKSIADGKMELRDATKADVNDGVRSYALDSEAEEPVFQQGVDQW